eukprot:NODE_6281_length_517_cov_245.329004.p1 GENE.NODE_6281_length_517_cov_245.329004~~NODE_6281_length_517_cov_245.329004.p1  ORF type:complete len:136 (+),score=44.52 NODE_6281_length_517_cov_245.329004:3-410(+)
MGGVPGAVMVVPNVAFDNFTEEFGKRRLRVMMQLVLRSLLWSVYQNTLNVGGWAEHLVGAAAAVTIDTFNDMEEAAEHAVEQAVEVFEHAAERVEMVAEDMAQHVLDGGRHLAERWHHRADRLAAVFHPHKASRH